MKRVLIGYNANKERARGVEWSDLLELQLRLVRQSSASMSKESTKNILTSADSLHEQILEEKNRKIEELQGRLEEAFQEGSSPLKISSDNELFPGEFSERVLAYLAHSQGNSGISLRTKEAIKSAISRASQFTPSKDFIRDLKLCRDVDSLIWFLRKVGYSHTQDGKHHKLSPPSTQIGLGTITLSKTPGDRRSQSNAISDTKKALGLDF